MKKIVIAGAGFGGAYVFKRLHAFFHGRKDTQLILVNPTNYFLFTPLLHEVATGGILPSMVTEPLRKVLGCCLADFNLADVTGVDLSAKKVRSNQGEIDYDYLVLALGSKTAFFDTPGAEENAYTLKTLPDAMQLKRQVIGNFEKAAKEKDFGKRKKLLRFVVVGGGPTGVELVAELTEWCRGTFSKYYPREIASEVEVVLLEVAPQLLGKMPERFGRVSRRVLEEKGVQVRLGERVVQINEKGIELDGGEFIETATPIWVAGVEPVPVIFQGDVDIDERGRVLVEQTFQLEKYPEVLALGDMVRMKDRENLPQLAQVATKEAKTVADNLVAVLNGENPKRFEYRHAGDLLSLGHWMALGNIGGWFFRGRFAWWLWRTVYLSKLLSWPKKVQVATQWTLDLFSPRDISRV